MLVFFIHFSLFSNAQTNAYAKTVFYTYNNEDSAAIKKVTNEDAKIPGNIIEPKQTPAKKRAYERQAKTFKVYPNPANNFVYMKYYGEGMITLHNSSDSLIFKARIREKATVNIRKLPVGSYYFTDIRTGLKQQMIIAR